MRAAWVLAVFAFGLALSCAPVLPDGDGLGYLKAALSGDLYPGHLIYVPLLRLFAGARAADGLFAARLVSAASGALAVLALAGAARRLLPRLAHAPLVAAAGLFVSYGWIAAASDVETYAPALAALCAALFCLSARRAGSGRAAVAGAATFAALATLLHVENLLFVLPALALLGTGERSKRDRIADGALFAALFLAITGAAYALAIARHGAGWLLHASHGFRYPLRAATPAIALYGVSKSLVYSPYPYEAPWSRVIACFLAGAASLGALLALVFTRRAPSPLPRVATLAWLLPYSAVGVAFFASDHERWVFLLPLLWLHVAASLRPRIALAVCALTLASNLAFVIPRARDTAARDRARACAAHLAPGDLVVSPGHGWDEYLGFSDGPAVEPFPLVYFAARLGDREKLRAALSETIAAARARNRRVLLARLAGDDSPLGWKELAPFGITRENAPSLLPPGTRTPLGCSLERLDP